MIKLWEDLEVQRRRWEEGRGERGNEVDEGEGSEGVEESTVSRMASFSKLLPPPTTTVSSCFMPQPVAGTAAPVVFQMLCTESQQTMYVKAPSSPGTFFGRFLLLQFH